MIINTTGLEREQVLDCLYNNAVKKLYKQTAMNESFAAASKYDGTTFAVQSIIISTIDLSAPTYNFENVLLGIGEVTIPLFVTLKNKNEFDSTEYDKIYGESTAQKIIGELKRTLENTSKNISARSSRASSSASSRSNSFSLYNLFSVSRKNSTLSASTDTTSSAPTSRAGSPTFPKLSTKIAKLKGKLT